MRSPNAPYQDKRSSCTFIKTALNLQERREIVEELKKDLREIKEELLPIIKRLPAYSRLIARIMKDSRIKMAQKTVLTSGLGYALSPVDVIPGFIPIAGQLDDLIVLLSTLKKTLKDSPEEVVWEHLEKTGLTQEIIANDLAVSKKILKILGKIGFAASKRAFLRTKTALGEPALQLFQEKISQTFAKISKKFS